MRRASPRPFSSTASRRPEQHIERQPAAMRLGAFKRQHPGRDRRRHSERRKRTARRNGLVVAIELRPGVGARTPRRHQRADAARRLAHHPEAVAADVIHVRIDRRDGGGHRDHGLERVAAFGEDRPAGLGGGVMWRGGDAAAMSGGVKVHLCPCGFPEEGTLRRQVHRPDSQLRKVAAWRRPCK